MKHSACLDLEGVLIPEIWPWLAHRTGIEGFSRTTRDEPDYNQLMIDRIALLREHDLRLSDVQRFVSELSPLPGALDFVEWMSQVFQVTLVSDAFVQMVEPFWRIFGQPTLRCHRLVCDTEGFITHAQYSRCHGKHEVIEEFQAQGQWVLAVGDAYNDLSMLRRANLGFLYRPSASTAAAARDVYVADSYDQIAEACIKLADR